MPHTKGKVGSQIQGEGVWVPFRPNELQQFVDAKSVDVFFLTAITDPAYANPAEGTIDLSGYDPETVLEFDFATYNEDNTGLEQSINVGGKVWWLMGVDPSGVVVLG